MMAHGHKLVALCGQSGSGKTSIARLLVEQHGYAYLRGVSTRPRREGEGDFEYEALGLSKREFEDYRACGKLLEYARHGEHEYGMLRPDDLGMRPYVCVVNPEGVEDLDGKLGALLFVVAVIGNPRAEWYAETINRRARDRTQFATYASGAFVLEGRRRYDCTVYSTGANAALATHARVIARAADKAAKERAR